MAISTVLRLARRILARERLGWSAIEAWALRYPGAYQAEVTIHRRPPDPIEVVVVCLSRDRTHLARRCWFTRQLGADLAERPDHDVRVLAERPGARDV